MGVPISDFTCPACEEDIGTHEDFASVPCGKCGCWLTSNGRGGYRRERCERTEPVDYEGMAADEKYERSITERMI